MKIYIVRHGETDSNKAGKLMGQRIDESLNAEGLKQARKLAEDLALDKFDVIFSSPLKRAVETAKIISDKMRVPVVHRKNLMERDFGNLSGRSWDEMLKGVGPEITDFRSKDFEQSYNYRPYGGESVEDVKKRFLEFIEELKKDYSDKKVLIVAHGGIMKLAHLLFREKFLDATPENASLHEFEV